MFCSRGPSVRGRAKFAGARPRGSRTLYPRFEVLEERTLLSTGPVRDIQASPASTYIWTGTVAGDRLFFQATGPGTGAELWVSDGTDSGTRLLKDINPLGSSAPQAFATVHEAVFFIAETPQLGFEPWMTDGTEAGTVLVKDISPGPQRSVPGGFVYFEGATYFSATMPETGRELWRTDGKEDGTSIVRDIAPAWSSSDPERMTVAGDTLFFVATDAVHGRELWKTDGTYAGTVLVRNIRRGAGSAFSGLTPLVAVGSRVFFFADDGVHGPQVWRSDGTRKGTLPLTHFQSAELRELKILNGTIYFSVINSSEGPGLWESDGTEAGTVLVNAQAAYDLVSGLNYLYFTAGCGFFRTDGTGAGTVQLTTGYVWNITSVGSNVFFAVSDGSGGQELWVSDGTAEGTVRLRSISSQRTSTPRLLAAWNNEVFLAADDGAHGLQLWKSDGTAAGTAIVKQIRPGTGDAFNDLSPAPVQVGNATLFLADDSEHGMQLWRSDGTTDGTRIVRDIKSSYWSVPELAATHSFAFFHFYRGVRPQLWSSDGTEFGTRRIQRVVATRLTPVADQLFFVGSDDEHGWELWKSDGTRPGTTMVRDLGPGRENGSIGELVPFGNELAFSACPPDRGCGIWKTDGTAAGTVRLSRDAGSWLTAVGNVLFFITYGPQGPQLWRSAGTRSGTVLVRDLGLIGGLEVAHLMAAAGMLFFAARTQQTGWELWKSDGTPAGTALVKDIHDGAADAFPDGLAPLFAAGSFVFFPADDGEHGRELWRSDGTALGTFLLRDVNPGQDGAIPDERFYGAKCEAAVGATLFFAAYEPNTGVEIWRTDGTPPGTSLAQDIYPGPGSSFPCSLSASNGRLFFSADDGLTGRELWQLDPDTTELG